VVKVHRIQVVLVKYVLTLPVLTVTGWGCINIYDYSNATSQLSYLYYDTKKLALGTYY